MLIRPIDVVPGYIVPDGQAARQMPNSLADGGPIFAGPDADHIWAQSGETDRPSAATLTRSATPIQAEATCYRPDVASTSQSPGGS